MTFLFHSLVIAEESKAQTCFCFLFKSFLFVFGIDVPERETQYIFICLLSFERFYYALESDSDVAFFHLMASQLHKNVNKKCIYVGIFLLNLCVDPLSCPYYLSSFQSTFFVSIQSKRSCLNMFRLYFGDRRIVFC